VDNPRLTLTVNEAANMLGISRGLAYQMVKMGKIPSVRFGKRVLVPRSALEKLLAESKPLNLTAASK
jgi:excisionase family DNA binding protein